MTRGTPTRFTGRILNFALIGSLSSPYTFAALSGNPSPAKRNAGEREGEILTFSLSKICHKNPRSNSSNTRESVSFDFQSRSIFFYAVAIRLAAGHGLKWTKLPSSQKLPPNFPRKPFPNLIKLLDVRLELSNDSKDHFGFSVDKFAMSSY